jgi:23S rRNA pseudouridine2604 synthase
MGRYRDLTDAEIKELNELIEPSSKTEEASLPRTETLKENRIHQKTTPGSRKKEIIKFQYSPVLCFKILVGIL